MSAVGNQFVVRRRDPETGALVPQRSLRPTAPAAVALEDDHWVPTMRPDTRASTATGARVRLPARAGMAFDVEDIASGVAISVRAVDANDARCELAEPGAVLYRGAIGGADWVHLARAEGVEDYVVFDVEPAEKAVRYDVRLSIGARVRQVGNTVEILDVGGAPRLRMAPPSAVDSHGTALAMTTQVDGCAVDRDPRPPWGRAIAPAGRACRMTVAWSGGVYPVLVDPAWTTAGSMVAGRIFHTSSTLSDGRVLVAGGADSEAKSLAEIYDPATATWASVGAMSTARFDHEAASLSDGRVLVTGGKGSTYLATAEVFDPATGTWASAGTMARPRSSHTASTLPDGRVLVVGGGDASSALSTSIFWETEVYNPATNAWTAGADAAEARYGHTASTLPDGRVLIVGGHGGTTELHMLASAEIYDGVKNAWVTAAPLSAPRYRHAASPTAGGRVLVSGGQGEVDYALSTTELYDPVADTWVAGAPLATARRFLTSSALPDGRVLAAGGTDAKGYGVKSSEVYEPATNTWASGGVWELSRIYHVASTLADGRVLVTGGGMLDLRTAEVFSLLDAGQPCADSPGACKSGMCRDGVCCDTTCAGPCEACSASKKGQGVDGQCGPVSDVGPPVACPSGVLCAGGGCPLDCSSDGQCAPSHLCNDETHTCVPKGADGKACTSAAHCASGFCVDGVCCDVACEGACRSCLGAATQVGVDGTCSDAIAGTNPNGGCGPGVGCDSEGHCGGPPGSGGAGAGGSTVAGGAGGAFGATGPAGTGGAALAGFAGGSGDSGSFVASADAGPPPQSRGGGSCGCEVEGLSSRGPLGPLAALLSLVGARRRRLVVGR